VTRAGAGAPGAALPRLALALAAALLAGAVLAGALHTLRSEGRLPPLAVDQARLLRSLDDPADRQRLIREWRLLAVVQEQSKYLANSRLGQLYLLEGRYDEAVERLQRALRYRPDSATAHANLASALAAREQYGEAIRHLRRALEIEPGNPALEANLAVLLEQAR
jgi:tetratricopeptide (TPR) repeat protein